MASLASPSSFLLTIYTVLSHIPPVTQSMLTLSCLSHAPLLAFHFSLLTFSKTQTHPSRSAPWSEPLWALADLHPGIDGNVPLPGLWQCFLHLSVWPFTTSRIMLLSVSTLRGTPQGHIPHQIPRTFQPPHSVEYQKHLGSHLKTAE